MHASVNNPLHCQVPGRGQRMASQWSEMCYWECMLSSRQNKSLCGLWKLLHKHSCRSKAETMFNRAALLGYQFILSHNLDVLNHFTGIGTITDWISPTRHVYLEACSHPHKLYPGTLLIEKNMMWCLHLLHHSLQHYWLCTTVVNLGQGSFAVIRHLGQRNPCHWIQQMRLSPPVECQYQLFLDFTLLLRQKPIAHA